MLSLFDFLYTDDGQASRRHSYTCALPPSFPFAVQIPKSSIPTSLEPKKKQTLTLQKQHIEMAAILGKAYMLGMLTLKVTAARNTPSPNHAIPKPECDESIPVKVRYSAGSARLYVVSADGSTRGGCVKLAQIWEERGGKAPLYAVDPESGDISNTMTGTWMLTEELYVQDGITLQVRCVVFLPALCSSQLVCKVMIMSVLVP